MKNSILLTITALTFVLSSCLKDDTEPTQVVKTNNPLITEFDKSINAFILKSSWIAAFLL